MSAVAVVTDPAHGVLVVRAAGGWDFPRVAVSTVLPATAGQPSRLSVVGAKIRALTGYPFSPARPLSFGGTAQNVAYYFHQIEHDLEGIDWEALWADAERDRRDFGFAVRVGDAAATRAAPFVVVELDGRRRAAEQTLASGALDAFRYSDAKGAFPPLASIWYRTILFQNDAMPGIDTELAAFALDFLFRVQSSAGASGAAVLQETPFYRAALSAVLEWKGRGMFNGGNADEMQALSSAIEAAAASNGLDLRFGQDVTMFRVDAGAASLAVGASLFRDQLSFQLKRGCFGAPGEAAEFVIRSGVQLFPVFMFDKRDEYFNECEVLAIGNLEVTKSDAGRFVVAEQDVVERGVFTDLVSSFARLLG
jgi:hypothetical protein